MNVLLNIKAKRFDRLVFNNVNFCFKSHHFYMLIAPSGSGKTTLFNMLIGEDQKYNGEITYNDIIIDNHTRSSIRKDYIGILFQNFELNEDMNAYDNVLLSVILSKVNLDNIDEKIKKLFKSLGIEECLKKDIHQLSTGQKQRVAFARTIIKEPQVIICDEPTGNLDEENEYILMNYLKQYFEEHECTIILATHNKNLRSYATDIITIHDYQIVHLMEKKELLSIENKQEVQARKYSLLSFFLNYFGKHTFQYVVLSFFISICMIGIFISFNFGYTLIEKIEDFLENDVRNRSVYVYPDYTITSMIPNDISKALYSLDNVESIDFGNDAFGRYGLEKIYQSIQINDKQIIQENNIFLSTTLGTSRTIISGKEIQETHDIIVSKNFLELVNTDILGKELKMTLPLVSKYIQEPFIDEYGEFIYQNKPELSYHDDSFKIVGVCEDKDLGTESYEIFFNENYINNLLEKKAQPLNNPQELSYKDYIISTIITDGAKYNEGIVQQINNMNIGLKASTDNNYESLQYIVQEKNIFLLVEFLLYIIILYSILEILKLTYKYKQNYLHNMQLLGCSNKDIQLFYIIESGLLFILSALMTFSLNILVLNSLNNYFVTQNFMSNIILAFGDIHIVYMDLPVFGIIIMVHLVIILLLQYFYYKKTIGGNIR